MPMADPVPTTTDPRDAEIRRLRTLLHRWQALDEGAWHVVRHEREKAELMADTKAELIGR